MLVLQKFKACGIGKTDSGLEVFSAQLGPHLPNPLANPAAEWDAAVTAALAAQLLYEEYPAAAVAAAAE